MTQLNSKGEVADFFDVDQFIKGKSAYECVCYCIALVKFAGAPGKGPTGSIADIIALAQYWYGRLTGSTDASNTSGMSLDQEYQMLKGVGLSSQALSPTIAAIKSALEQGMPVLVCGAETGFHDLELGDNVPYAWQPSGNHCIVASGIASDGNLLVHDAASIAPNGVRPGPRRYDAAKMQLVSATAVKMPWLAPEPPKEEPAMNAPEGWKDDGKTLTAPNGLTVKAGFRTYVLSHNWNKDDWPLEEEKQLGTLEDSNPSLGGGAQQIFRMSMLGATASRGVFVEWIGQELIVQRANVAKYWQRWQDAKNAAPAADLQQRLDAALARLSSIGIDLLHVQEEVKAPL